MTRNRNKNNCGLIGHIYLPKIEEKVPKKLRVKLRYCEEKHKTRTLKNNHDKLNNVKYQKTRKITKSKSLLFHFAIKKDNFYKEKDKIIKIIKQLIGPFSSFQLAVLLGLIT